MKIGLRPCDFWKLKPVELADIAESYFEREGKRSKELWRIGAFVVSWIINTAGKVYERDISADELVSFKDEVKKKGIKPLSPEERRKQADETLMLHKKKSWGLLALDDKGKVKIFDEEKLKKLKERYRKK